MKKTEHEVKGSSKTAHAVTATHSTAAQAVPEEKHESVNAVVKRITERAKPADQFEYDDADYAQSIFDKLPEAQYAIKHGEKTVIQKL